MHVACAVCVCAFGVCMACTYLHGAGLRCAENSGEKKRPPFFSFENSLAGTWVLREVVVDNFEFSKQTKNVTLIPLFNQP
jgi:hypothetical protein